MKSKLILLLLFTYFICMIIDSNAQTYTTEASDTTNVYAKSFLEFERYVGKYFPSVKQFLVEESIITTTWLNPIGKKFVTRILPLSEVPSEFKKQKGNMHYIRVVPIRFENGFFFVNIIPFRVNHRKNKTEFMNSGALTIKFRFDCSSNQFMFATVEGGFSELE